MKIENNSEDILPVAGVYIMGWRKSAEIGESNQYKCVTDYLKTLGYKTKGYFSDIKFTVNVIMPTAAGFLEDANIEKWNVLYIKNFFAASEIDRLGFLEIIKILESKDIKIKFI